MSDSEHNANDLKDKAGVALSGAGLMAGGVTTLVNTSVATPFFAAGLGISVPTATAAIAAAGVVAGISGFGLVILGSAYAYTRIFTKVGTPAKK